MTVMPCGGLGQEAQLDAIRQLLGKAIRERRQKLGVAGIWGLEHEAKVQRALEAVVRICEAFRETMFEEVHSVRVRQIEEDFDALSEKLRAFNDQELTDGDQAGISVCIRTWHFESRRWVAELPMQAVLRRLPAKNGLSSAARLGRLKACWKEAGATWFAPPPRRANQLPEGVPDHFGHASVGGFASLGMDPIESVTSGIDQPRWSCRPKALLEVLEWAREALWLEVGGSDRGGQTTFAQRRRRYSLKHALAFSCAEIFETTVGPKSAHQVQVGKRGESDTRFAMFVAKVYALAVGGEVPREWRMGPDPIRQAVRTLRAWHKAIKAAGVKDREAFNALSPEQQMAAVAHLDLKVRSHLRPTALPWI